MASVAGFDFVRYLDAQDGKGPGSTYEQALHEMEKGRKEECWIWYIFPQFLDTRRGKSKNSKDYQLHNRAEVIAYLKHEVLGMRLVEISEALSAALDSAPVSEVMRGTTDAKKLHQCITCFHRAAADAEMKVEVTLFEKILGQIHAEPYEGYKANMQHEDTHMVEKWESMSA